MKNKAREVKKLGRNDPCWCGSGEKYKRCHLNRESAAPLPYKALEDAGRVREKRCLHPSAAAGVCDRIVSAHTIQRSRILQRIVDSTGKLLTFFPPQLEFSTGYPRLQLNRVGWRQASTFTGFCARHDSVTFKPLETKPFDENDIEQSFLVGYRALCHEVYTKSALLKSTPAVRRLADRGLSPELQREIQGTWDIWAAGTRKGLADFESVKDVMDEQILNGSYSGWARAVISFEGDLCVASTGAISPNRDIDGKKLQTLHNIESEVQEMMFGLTATPGGGTGVFIWRESDSAPLAFVRSLLRYDRRVLPSLIVQFMFAHIENTYFSDKWWGTLSQIDRSRIESLANISNPYYTEFRYLPFAKLVPWNVTNVLTIGAASA
jgi:hypothetical protein